MKIMVSGATGLIGIPLVLRLANGGDKIHALCRSMEKATAINHPNVTVFLGDLTDDNALKEALKGCDQVYHLAAFARVWHKEKGYFHKINVEGTKKLIDFSIASGVKRIVFTSTAGVLKPSNRGYSDETSMQSDNFFTEYEKSKSDAEVVVKEKNSPKTEIVIVNPSRLYGPGLLNESNSVTKLILQYISGRWHFLPGNGKSKGNYAYIHDVVNGMILAMKRGLPGENYILGGHNLSYKELFQSAGKVTGKQYLLFPIPLWGMLAASWFMHQMAKITGKSPAITPGWVRKYNHHWQLSCKKAIEEIGYTITPFEEGIKAIVKNFKNREII